MKHTITGFVTYRAPHEWETAPKVDFYTYDPRKFGSHQELAVVREHSFEVEVPDNFDPRPQFVANLDRQIEKVRADFTARVTQLQEQRNRLLALEMTQ